MHVKDLIRLLNSKNGQVATAEIIGICHQPWFIPETTSLRDQLLAFRSKRQHFAFVVDEYGALLGIVTLEDIIEEIVGDIRDEHDEASTHIQKIGKNAYLVDGHVTLRDLNRHLDWDLADDDASTVAGLLIHKAEKIPAIGEAFVFEGKRFTVTERNTRQITRLKIETLQETKL